MNQFNVYAETKAGDRVTIPNVALRALAECIQNLQMEGKELYFIENLEHKEDINLMIGIMQMGESVAEGEYGPHGMHAKYTYIRPNTYKAETIYPKTPLINTEAYIDEMEVRKRLQHHLQSLSPEQLADDRLKFAQVHRMLKWQADGRYQEQASGGDPFEAKEDHALTDREILSILSLYSDTVVEKEMFLSVADKELLKKLYHQLSDSNKEVAKKLSCL